MLHVFSGANAPLAWNSARSMQRRHGTTYNDEMNVCLSMQTLETNNVSEIDTDDNRKRTCISHVITIQQQLDDITNNMSSKMCIKKPQENERQL